MTRYFRPWFLIPCEPHVPALDQVQSVAAVFDCHGTLLRTVDWSWSAPPHWAEVRPRRIGVAGSPVWGDDGAGSDVARLDVDTDGQVSTNQAPSFTEEQAQRLHMYAPWRTKQDGPRRISGMWQVRATRGDGRRRSTPPSPGNRTAPSAPPPLSTWATGRWCRPRPSTTPCSSPCGSGRRPFTLRPPVDLVRVEPDGPASTVLPVDGLDITVLCRPARRWLRPPPEQVARDWLNDHLSHMITDHPAISDLTVTVRDWHTDPLGDISLRHTDRPGLLLVWRQHLCTEFGYTNNPSWRR